jgi:Oxidoreductase family, NAD-binding Rossmann fold
VPEHTRPDRRDFLRLGAAAAGLALLPNAAPAQTPPAASRGDAPAGLPKSPPLDRVRMGFVGVGGMGSHHLLNCFLKIDGVDILAICDIKEDRVKAAQDALEKAGRPRPAAYGKSTTDFVRMCESEPLDLVFTATPWEWHVPVCVAAMKNGKHAATEVPAALTVEECWQLVETAEKTARHCVMMENCCYDRPEMMVLHMLRRGVLGEPVHAEVGYQHDLRGVKFDENGEGWWRRPHSSKRDANLYPTHGLGPAAQAMDINRGDRFDYLVSMSGPSRGLQEFQKTLKENDPRRTETYKLGDVNLSMIKTKLGRTIYLVHDTNLPRPYERFNLFQGTRGLYRGFPPRFHIEGRSEGHGWTPLDKFAEEFDHPLWKSAAVKKAAGGHGGMDFLEDYRLIQCLRSGEPTDMNVYDAAALSCVTELTERSNAARSAAQDFPDFTRGGWKTWPTLDIVAG